MQRTATTYADLLAQWTHLSASLANNAGTLPHLEGHRQVLDDLMAEFQALSAQQALQAAAKQDTTKRLQDVLDQGRKLATFLRSGIRQHFGTRSEKLVEFGLQPYRGRNLPPPPANPPVELAAPEPGSDRQP